jgi:hypothetical protein
MDHRAARALDLPQDEFGVEAFRRATDGDTPGA